MIDHDRIEERIVAYSLGELRAEERAAFEAEMREHTRGCGTCAALYADLREVAGRLALATPPVQPPAALEERLMQRAAGRDERSRDVLRPGARLRRVAAGIAAAAVLVVGSVAGTLAITRAEARPLHVVEMAAASGGRLALVYAPGTTRAVVVADDLPTPQGQRVYQLWIRVGGEMAGAGTFRPVDGDAVNVTTLPASEFDLVAVTVEPSGGSPQPTSDPIASAPTES